MIPPLALAALIFKYAVNVPFWDQWSIASQLEDWRRDPSRLSILFHQANESRFFIPSLFLLALTKISRGNVYFEIAATYFLVCAAAWMLYRLSRRTFPESKITCLALLFFSNALLFSTRQHETWLWGIMFSIYIPALCLLACILLMPKVRGPARFWLCAFLSLTAAFSFSSGLALWPLIGAVLVWYTYQESRERALKTAAAWIAVSGIALALYFYHYENLPHLPAPSTALRKPVESVRFLLYFLSTPWMPAGHANTGILKNLACGAGALQLGLWFFFFYAFVLRKEKLSVAGPAVGWLALGGYAIAGGIMAAIGRIGKGEHFALASRYTSTACCLSIALIYLGVLWLKTQPERKRRYSKMLPGIAGAAALSAFLAVYLPVFSYGAGQMEATKQKRLHGKAVLLFFKVMPKKDCLSLVTYYNETRFAGIVERLSRNGALDLPWIRGTKAAVFAAGADIEGDAPKRGSVENFLALEDNRYKISGRAYLPQKKRPADLVLLTYQDENGNEELFDIVCHPKTGARSDEPFVWTETISRNTLPPGELNIRAWAFDAERILAFPLENTGRIHE